MFKSIRKTIGNFLVTFTKDQVDLWISEHEPPPNWNWYWAQTHHDAIDILTCYFVAKCEIRSFVEGVNIIDYLVQYPGFWPVLKPKISMRADHAQNLEKWIYTDGPYSRYDMSGS
jgi:hypothetical protein